MASSLYWIWDLTSHRKGKGWI